MRTMLVALSVAADTGFVCWQSAGAAPVNPAAVKQAATRAGRGSLPLPSLLVLIESPGF